MAPHRDPETGKFVAGEAFDDIEVATFQADIGVAAADLTGGTGFAGGQVLQFESVDVVDYDDLVDRNESLRLLSASHALTVSVNSTETADGTVRGYVEVSTSPSEQVSEAIVNSALDGDVSAGLVGSPDSDDSIDVIGRPLLAVGHAPFSDSATGVGGAGSAGHDQVDVENVPEEIGRLHPRDDLFVNGAIRPWNIDDAGVHIDVTGQHVYGVLDD